MARDLRLGDREAHVREQAASAALADVPLGLDVGLGRRRADRVDADLVGQALELFSAGQGGRHERIVP